MRKQRYMSVFVVLGIILTACSFDEGITPADDLPPADQNEAFLKGAKNHEVPFKSKFLLTSLDFYMNEGEDFFHQELKGSGNATHMGKTEVYIPDELLYPGEDGINWTATAEVILTAANGDKLFFNYASAFEFVSYPVDVIGYGTINGGTGRFENATGTMTYTGHWPGETGSVTFNGMIQY
jgi:hypothetical protein